MTDILERLDACHKAEMLSRISAGGEVDLSVYKAAADEIRRLRAIEADVILLLKPLPMAAYTSYYHPVATHDASKVRFEAGQRLGLAVNARGFKKVSFE